MAVDYSIILDTTMSRDELVTWRAAECDLKLCARPPGHTVIKNEGVTCFVGAQSALGRELVRETFDIGSTMRIDCRPDKFEHHEHGMDTFVWLCKTTLAGTACDMVALENGETALLLRKDGTCFADCREDYWRRTWHPAFAAIGLSFAERELPMI